MNKDQYYVELASKWLKGTITEEEKVILSAWYQQEQDEEVHIPKEFAISEEELEKRMFLTIKKRIDEVEEEDLKRYPFFTWRKIAASIALICCLSGLLWYSVNKTYTKEDHYASILPGGNKAILQLSNGQQLNLDSIKAGSVVLDGGLQITKTTEGEIVYSLQNQVAEGQAPIFNTISTPKGGEFQVVLSDGSKIWLNAATTIQYPITFAEDYREVNVIHGEAYFEINKASKNNKPIPFYVKSSTQQIAVLGTKFNVNAYSSNVTQTTLIEGSVEIRNTQTLGSRLLIPGEQSLVQKGSDIIDVKAVSADQYTAWKDGLFYFESADLNEVLAQFSRWYDIEVEIPTQIKKYEFMGKFPRSTSLKTALLVLKSSGVAFELENRKLIIKTD
ncbi:FecR family protein [Sphingobacterium sp. HJSM2_6]|uniref:FecR family protein n=1 Tax=Sphingobacterium sp. HJSM2_6 TaxID=3366264 RepID=UPI003BC9912B